MHIHILGICGTFMGGLAILAKQLGHRVSGSDKNVYPPMSTQLESQGINLYEGYGENQFQPEPDLVIVGNALSRGNPAIEYMLNRRLRYTSGPQWMSEHLLRERWVIAAAGTHGKTTTSSMVAWILEFAGLNPGFLIGGVPKNFGVSARLGDSPFFVIEADEYDTAFFDKRSKFLHYHPQTAILNNLEFDHADIFPDIASIERQFHHLVRVIPENGKIIRPLESNALNRVIDQGCWSPIEYLEADDGWSANLLEKDGSHFEVNYCGEKQGEVVWSCTGQHNVMNGLAAIAASRHAGVEPKISIEALAEFEGVKRRMELSGIARGVNVYDDFAHHPTAIQSTLEGLRASVGSHRIIAVIEPRSNTMRMGIHKETLANSCDSADEAFWYHPESLEWDVSAIREKAKLTKGVNIEIFSSIADIISRVVEIAQPGDSIVIMSNGGFGAIHQKLLERLADD